MMEALRVLKHYQRGERMDFTAHWMAKDTDYAIKGAVTKTTVEEAIDELLELLANMPVEI